MTKSILVLILGLAAAACGGAPTDDSPATGAAETTAAPSAAATAGGRDLDAYPQPYRTMNLPALPGATVTSTGRQETSLRDGLAIRLTTSMSVAETRDYYRQELTSRGWAEETGPGQAAQAMLPDLPLARLSFVQGPLAYAVTATANDDSTQVLINLVER